MRFLLLSVFMWHVALLTRATVTYTVNEVNVACTSSIVSIGLFPSNTVLFRAPLHGELIECGDLQCTRLGNTVQPGQSLRIYYGYLPNEDYSNVFSESFYASNGDIVTTETQTSSLDFLQAIDVVTNNTITRVFKVYARSSVPRIEVDSTLIGGISNFAANLRYSDPDGDSFLHEFYFFSDQAKLVVYSSIFPGTCTDGYCVFKSRPSMLKYYLGLIQYQSFRPVPLFNRVKLVLNEKIRLDPSKIGIELCSGLTKAIEKVEVYCTLQSVSSLPSTNLLYTSATNSVAYKGMINPERGKIIVNGTIQYVPYNPYSFSSIGGVCHLNDTYDTFKVEAIYSSAEAECLVSVDTNVSTCLDFSYSVPTAPSFTVRDILLGGPRLFKIPMFDADDQTFGEVDGNLSPSSFFELNGSVSSVAGIIFSRAIFASGAIYDETCTQQLALDTVYSSLVFCYVAESSGSFESTFISAIDRTGIGSEIAVLSFENPHDLYICSAQPYDGIEAQECTSVGQEYNKFWGGTSFYIPVSIHVFDYASPGQTFRLVIESLPSHGALYRCNNDPCTQPGAKVNQGDIFGGVPGNTTYMLYVGNENYFNYAIYDLKMLGGLYGITLRQCQEECDVSDITCPARCAVQTATQNFYGISEYINSYSDRKGKTFWDCGYAADFGCPDTFSFRVETRYRSYPENVYNIYVQNMPSGATLGQPRFGTNEYIPTVPSAFNIRYDDPDLDTWDVAIELNTSEVYIGNANPMNVYITNETMCVETGECKGKIVAIGLPSDIDYLLEYGYISYIRRKDEALEGNFSIRFWKAYWGPSRAFCTVPIYDVYDNVPITPDANGVIKADKGSVYYSDIVKVEYRVKAGYENVYYNPKTPDVGEIVLEVFTTLIGFLIPVPGLDIVAGFSSLARTVAVTSEQITARGTLEFIYDGGYELISAIVRVAQKIGRFIGAVGKFIFRKLIFAFDLLKAALRGAKRFLYPREKIPERIPEPNPPEAELSSAARGFIEHEQPIPKTNVATRFFNRIYPRRSPRNPEVPEPPLVPKPELPTEVAAPAELTGIRGLIARSPLGRLQTAYERLVATKTYRVFSFIKSVIKNIEKLIVNLSKWFRSIFQRIRNLLSIVRKFAMLRLARLARWFTKSLGAIRYIGKFGRLLLYVIIAGGKLIADAALDAASVLLWAIMGVSSGISWVIHIFRFTREYSKLRKRVVPVNDKNKATDRDIEKYPIAKVKRKNRFRRSSSGTFE